MIFNYNLGIQQVSESANIIYREAIRAVIIDKDSILMIYTNKGDYKFPGGGANKEENHHETLKREVKEETGYSIERIGDKVGVIIENSIDRYERDSVFQMISHYYLCTISDKQTSQHLDHYEAEQDFKPVWINIDKAIENNEQILQCSVKEKNPWVDRETMVLKVLKRAAINIRS